MARRHLILMALGCLIPIAALIAISIFHLQPGRLVLFGLFLLCPAMHLLMMRGHAGQQEHREESHGH